MARPILPFAIGLVVGAYITKNWSTISVQAIPATQEALNDLSDALDRGRQAWMAAAVKSEGAATDSPPDPAPSPT
jgi:hypothetical protein